MYGGPLRGDILLESGFLFSISLQIQGEVFTIFTNLVSTHYTGLGPQLNLCLLKVGAVFSLLYNARFALFRLTSRPCRNDVKPEEPSYFLTIIYFRVL